MSSGCSTKCLFTSSARSLITTSLLPRFVSPVLYFTVRMGNVPLTSMALALFRPFTRLRMTMMSEVTPAPPKVSLCIRNAPTTSALPSLTIQLRNFALFALSSVPLVLMNMPIPPSFSLRTFLAIQKSCIARNFFDKSLSPVSSLTRMSPNGTLVIAKSTLPLGMYVFSKPFTSTLASGYSSFSILPVVSSTSMA